MIYYRLADMFRQLWIWKLSQQDKKQYQITQNQRMSDQTLLSIIDQIERTAIRKKSTDSERTKLKWNKQNDNLIFQLILQFGQDVTLIHSYFPAMSRNQIRRKIRDVMQKRKNKLMVLQQRAQRERRKSFFDQEVLEEDCKDNI